MSLFSPSSYRQVTETAAVMVDLPNSDTVTDTFDLSQSSPASESTTLASSITAPPLDPNHAHVSPSDSSTPKSHTKPSMSSPSSDPTTDGTLLVDLGDASEAQAEVPASEEPSPLSPSQVVAPPGETEKESELLPSVQSASHASSNPISPQGHSPQPPIPSVNHDHQIDGELPLGPDTDVPQDGSNALGTAGFSGPSAPAHSEYGFLDDVLMFS